MKKVYSFLLLCMFLPVAMQAQNFTGLEVIEVLASDDFEDDEPWVNFDRPDDINLSLNNALGGSQDFSWSEYWGGACVHGGKSAIAGDKCVQLHWGGTLMLHGFEIDPEKIYQIEVMVHPQGGISGQWNNWGAMHLFVFDSPNVWQSQGVRIRLSNNEAIGETPSLLALDVWEGEEGAERPVNLLSFSEEFQKYAINDAADAEARNFWVPLKVVFKGEGTVDNPFLIDFYLNDIYVASEKFDNLVWLGDLMVGLQSGADNPDIARYDNFKITEMKGITHITEIDNKALSVITGEDGIRLISDIYGKDVDYTVYNISGKAVMQGKVMNNITDINSSNISAGVYILQVKNGVTKESKTIRAIVK